jgi:hypothetical protein
LTIQFYSSGIYAQQYSLLLHLLTTWIPYLCLAPLSYTTVPMHMEQTQKRMLGIILKRSYFHLRSLSGVMVTLPSVPVDTVSIRLVFAKMIQAVQVCGMACIVPPTSLVKYSTVSTCFVIIMIFGTKRVSTMESHGITCSACMHIWWTEPRLVASKISFCL